MYDLHNMLDTLQFLHVVQVVSLPCKAGPPNNDSRQSIQCGDHLLQIHCVKTAGFVNDQRPKATLLAAGRELPMRKRPALSMPTPMHH